MERKLNDVLKVVSVSKVQIIKRCLEGRQVANIAVKLLEFQGAVPDVEVVSPSTNDSVEVLYHFGERIAQALSFCDEVDFTANCFHGLW